MSKQAYSQMNTYLKALAKERKLSVEEFLSKVKPPHEFSQEDITANRKDYVISVRLWMELHVLKGKALHAFFTSPEFVTWLGGCVKTLDLRHAHALNEILHDGVGVLHFPTSAKMSSVACFIRTIQYPREGQIGNLFLSFSRDAYSPRLANGERLVSTPILCLEQNEKTLDEMDFSGNGQVSTPEIVKTATALVFGLGMYASCFPEMIQPGPPSDLLHTNHYDGPKIEIRIAPQVTHESTHDIVSPHFRRGHFRFLQSPIFTKKRFQTVFVHETFVKGRSVTVLSPEELIP